MSQKILGIDLGTYSVKLLYLERRVQDLYILNYLEEPINHSSRVPHEEQCRTIIEKIMTEQLIQPDIISVSLPSHLLSARIIELPFSNPKKIGQMIEFELESHIPFPIETVFTDFHLLKAGVDSDSQILCVYALEESLSKYLNNLKEAGVDPKYFGAEFIDYAAISQIAMVPNEGYYALLDIGHNSANFLVMEGRELRYVRSIGIAGYHFTRAVQRAFNLNYEKAEALKLSRGKLYIRENESDHVSRILHKVALELVSNIKQTMLAARHIYPDLNVSAIYCSGGSAKLLGLIDFLSFHLRTNVFELDCLNFVNHHFDNVDEVHLTVSQVLANAIRPIYFNRLPRINFRKGLFAYTQDLQMITNEFKTVAAFLVAVILLGVGYYFYSDAYFERKMALIDKKIEDVVKKDFTDLNVKKGRGNSGKLTQYLKTAKTKLTGLKNSSPLLNRGDNTVLHLMHDISKALPAKKDVNFEINEFNFAEDFIRISASTNDTLNVEKIVGALKDSNVFGKIEPSDAKPQAGTNLWDFTVKLALQRDDEGEDE